MVKIIDITAWTNSFLEEIDKTFSSRVWFVGLQGSYARGEARDASDIDMVVILDELSATDIQRYHAMLEALPHRELVCGFLSGKNELLHWAPSDLFQFYYDTTPLKGSLDALLPLLDRAAIERAIKIGACSIYHGCVHNMLHERSEDVLKGLYKAAAFVVQALVFWQTGVYARQQRDLLALASSDERRIVDIGIALKSHAATDFDGMSEALFAWSKKIIGNTTFFT